MKVTFIDQDTNKTVLEEEMPTVPISACFTVDGQKYIIKSAIYETKKDVTAAEATVEKVAADYGKLPVPIPTGNPEETANAKTTE